MRKLGKLYLLSDAPLEKHAPDLWQTVSGWLWVLYMLGLAGGAVWLFL